MKKLLLGLAALLAVALVLAYVSLGAIVKKGVETYGPRMAGAPVSVTLVTLSPFSGRGAVRGLKIGNPPGFTSAYAVEVGKIEVELDVKSLLGSGRILIRDVVVDEPSIILETGKGGTNLQALQRNLDAYAPADPQEAAATEGRKIEIARFRLRGARAQALVPQLSKTPTSVSVPDLEITGIGAKSGGATAAEAAKQIMSALTLNTIKAAGGVGALLQRGAAALGGTNAAQKLEGLKDLFQKKKR